jgi:hypothetical protein
MIQGFRFRAAADWTRARWKLWLVHIVRDVSAL